MPAYIRHHDAEPMVIFCPSCMGLPLHIRDIDPVWSAARLDVIYECTDCGTEVRETVTKPERRH
jgi:hypothetical protein